MSHSGLNLEVLFIEDTIEDAELAVLNLSRSGYKVNWQRVDREEDLRSVLANWTPDVILSDYSMPGFSGHAALELCLDIVPDIPFIFLSGTIGEERAIEAIQNGATDYVLKENMKRLEPAVTRAINDAVQRIHAREIEHERSRLINILEATSDFVAIVHPDESLIYLNRGGRKLLKHDEHVPGLTLKNIYPGQQLSAIRKSLSSTEQIGLWQHDSLLIDSKGAEIPISQVTIAHKSPNGDPEYYAFIARDIRDRKAYEAKIQYLANYDPLTELANRTLLADRATQAIHHSEKNRLSLAIIVLDIDRFKLVNDGHGQDFGDALLKDFAKRLQSLADTHDTVARLSADYFAVLTTGLDSPEDVIALISLMQHELGRPFVIKGNVLSLTFSMGVSVYPRDGNNFDTLFRNADVAMHRVKEVGNSGFQFYTSEMTDRARHRVLLETELQHALPRRQLELYYQIQVALPEQRIIGVEALARWNHPQHGIISPDIFIPIAEDSDLICQIGEWALITACKQLKNWDQFSNQHIKMSVNVSMRQFRSKGFPEMVEHVLLSLQLDPARLELEITESVLAQDHEEAAGILNQLNALGVHISLDDFGTGYSNLSYLSRLPIHALKIDKSFVHRASIDNSDMEIVRAIISLADALTLRVIAEGIETREQLDMLASYGCSEGQGYYFSRPLPAQEILHLLKAGPHSFPDNSFPDNSFTDNKENLNHD